MRRELGICLLVWVALCAAGPSAVVAETEGVDLGRGQHWVRSHPFTIMGVSLVERPFDVELYRNAGFSSLLVWESQEEVLRAASEAGLPWHMHRYAGAVRDREPFGEKDRERFRQFVKMYPGGIGWIINDEPNKGDEMRVTAEVIDWLRQEFPDMLVYSNSNPDTPTRHYTRQFVETVNPDVLMYDRYPFDKHSEISEDFFWNMAHVRELALEKCIPYWGFVQAYEDRGRRRLPSESDLRMQTYAMLAYGYTGIAYFVYDLAVSEFERAVLEVDGTPSPLYAPTAKLNPEVANLGRCLRMLTSTSVHYVPAADSACPEGTTPWQDQTMIIETPGCDGLIGWFTDDAGGQYFIFVNLKHGADMSAEDGATTFRIRFGEPVTALHRLSRESGQVEPITLETDETGASGFSLSLPGGTGDLFKIGDGEFSGLQPQEPTP
ncbi:MAG: hypothetical protein IT445_03260 [Phycisphaeraceae bacterium]|nr:hypothetical protein [Phycisphaeraceae bacterium]